MKKIEAIIQPSRFEEVRTALTAAGYPGITLSEVKGHGKQKGLTKSFFGKKYTIEILPKLKLEIVAADADIEKLVKVIQTSASTGQTGDGKIFVHRVEQAYTISSGEEGEAAVS
jgi:nitrogen regulatory protein P-II 1